MPGNAHRHLYSLIQHEDSTVFGTELTRVLDLADQLGAAIVTLDTFVHASDWGGAMYSANIVLKVDADQVAITHDIVVSDFSETGGVISRDGIERLIASMNQRADTGSGSIPVA